MLNDMTTVANVLGAADPRYEEFSRIHVARDGDLLTISLNRPHVLNAVGDRLHEELEEVLIKAQTDPATAIVITGAGRSFCAGADLKEQGGPPPGGRDPVGHAHYLVTSARRLVDALLAIEQPIIAAVNGHAIGMGATLALMCDVVIAAEDAVLADTHVVAGLVAGDGGTVLWPMLVPFGTAKYYLLSGEPISGAEAARLGLVLRAVPEERLMEEACAVARRLSAGAPLAVRGTKRTINKHLKERLDLTLDSALALEGLTYLSSDHKEACIAFVEKREPVFRGQ
jgi:enoyl-CoA hydratase